VGKKYGVTGYPETFLINRQGMVVHHHIGYNNWTDPALVTALEGLINTGVWTLAEGNTVAGEQMPLQR
jgi:hypothetical protein